MRIKLISTVSVGALVVLVALAPARAEDFESFTEPYKRVAIPAREVGVISTILVQEGDEVLKSQVLARLDDSVLQSSLAVAKAAKDALGARRSAESELTLREKQLESYRELRDRGNATQRELERAESDLQQAKARLQTVHEDLEVRRLEYARVKAQIQQRIIESPMNGIVIAIDKEVGEFVSPTDPIVMHIVHIETLRSVFSVPMSAVGDLQPGQIVQLRVGHFETKCTGTIEFVSPVADAESGTVRVKVRIPNRDRQLASGAACRWDLNYESPVERTSRIQRVKSVR